MSTKLNVLLIDDKDFELESLTMLLEVEEYAVVGFTDPQEAMVYLAGNRVDVIVTDLQMPGMDGIEVTRRAKDLYPDVDVVLVTAYASIETAVKAMKEGASHYIVKSPTMGKELLATLSRMCREITLRQHSEFIEGEEGEEERLAGLVGRSAAMRRVFTLLRSVAPHETTVLIRGETGTGKGVAAAALHSLSPRRDRPMATVDCASLPQTLLESELFGHAKGAFTGAYADKEGKVKTAKDSTLFLDEIGDLPFPSQPKLLRLLEERVFCPLGSTKDLRSNARVVACTNRELEKMVEEKRFRLDLFHRLNVVTIRMPSFKERREDIPLLADFLMRRVAKRLSLKPKSYADETRAMLSRFDWPGNVRQLVHAIERSLVVGQGDKVVPEDLPPEISGAAAGVGGAPGSFVEEGTDSLADNERMLVERVLDDAGWNIHEAARRLQVSRPTLYSKIKRFGLEKKD